MVYVLYYEDLMSRSKTYEIFNQISIIVWSTRRHNFGHRKKTRNINEMLRGVMKWLLLVGARFVRDRLCAICLADLVLHEKSAILTEKKAPNFLSTSEARVLIKLAVFSINLP